MTFPLHFDPPIKVWVIPSDDSDLQPLPALLHKETEHEIIVSEYDRRAKGFLIFERERRAKAYRHFEECRVAMLQERSATLEQAKEHARNQASIYNHILSMTPQAFPDEKAEAFLAKPEQEEEVQEVTPEPAQEEPPSPTRRPSRRRRS